MFSSFVINSITLIMTSYEHHQYLLELPLWQLKQIAETGL